MRCTMTSREIVQRCIERRDPPRIAWHFEVSPIEGYVRIETDFRGVGDGVSPDFKPDVPGRTEWGHRMETLDPSGEGVGEPRDNPLADGWDKLDTYCWPDFRNEARYAGLDQAAARGHADGKYVYGVIPSLMLLPASLRGMENWFMDHVVAEDHLARLLRGILDIRLLLIERYHRAGVDGVITYDDMGTGERTLISPEQFRRLYFPPYKATCDALHDRGMHLLHHCCGQVRDFMPLFIEAGCDVIQLDQPRLMGIDWLAEHCGGKICFWNCVDIQATLPYGDPAAIDDEARRQVEKLGAFGGGFMVKAYQQPNSLRFTRRAFQAMVAAFHRYGDPNNLSPLDDIAGETV